MKPSELHALRDEHGRLAADPAHHPCDICKLLNLVNAQTRMLGQLIVVKGRQKEKN